MVGAILNFICSTQLPSFVTLWVICPFFLSQRARVLSHHCAPICLASPLNLHIGCTRCRHIIPPPHTSRTAFISTCLTCGCCMNPPNCIASPLSDERRGRGAGEGEGSRARGGNGDRVGVGIRTIGSRTAGCLKPWAHTQPDMGGG